MNCSQNRAQARDGCRISAQIEVAKLFLEASDNPPQAARQRTGEGVGDRVGKGLKSGKAVPKPSKSH